MLAQKRKVPLRKLVDFFVTTRPTIQHPFSIRFKRNQLSFNRYLVIVGKNVAKSAVTRNEIKRKIYNWLVDFETTLNASNEATDYVLVVTNNFTKVESQHWQTVLKKLLLK